MGDVYASVVFGGSVLLTEFGRDERLDYKTITTTRKRKSTYVGDLRIAIIRDHPDHGPIADAAKYEFILRRNVNSLASNGM